jgi:hypothetical protein
MNKCNLSPSEIIFVGGAPRSGTTLVQRILASHSMIYGGPEFDLIPQIVNLRNTFHGLVENGRINKYLTHSEVDKLFGEFISTAFSFKLDKLEGKRYVSEKTPANVTVFPELAEIFPNAHLVFVLRDPRAVVASMLQVGERYRKEGKQGPYFTMSVRGAVSYINECWAAGSKALEKHSNIQVVYYEDLILSAEEAVRTLAAGLGLPFEKKMVEMEEYDMPEFKIGEEHWYTKEQLQAPIKPDSFEAWRNQLSNYQQFYICKHINRMGPIARYDLRPDNSLQNRMIELIEKQAWRVRGVFRFVARKVGGVFQKL